jgi:hypothetical protein
MSTKKSRQQLSTKADIALSTARIRRWIDPNGMNKELQKQIDGYKKKLLEIKKSGAPTEPKAPAKPTKTDKALLAKYEKDKTDYSEKLKEYNKYESKAYTELVSAYRIYELLELLVGYLGQSKDVIEKSKEIIDTIKCELMDKPSPKKADEPVDKYKERVKEFKPQGFPSIHGLTELTDKDKLEECRKNLLEKKYPNIKLFIDKNEISKKKIRFNDKGIAAIAAFSEYIVRETALHAMITATSLDKNNKIIQPDHIINPGMPKLPLAQLYIKLPHLKLIDDRQKRRREYDQKVRNIKLQREKAERERSARLNVKAQKVNGKIEGILSFEEEEVKNGFAVKIIPDPKPVKEEDKKEEKKDEKPEEKKAPKPIYKWKGIDIEEEVEDPTDFKFYIKCICDDLKKTEASDSKIRVSNDIKLFLSNLIKDFLHMLSTQMRILLGFYDIKTVNEKVVITVVKLLLARNYHPHDGNIVWSVDHEKMFKGVEEKIKKIEEDDAAPASEPEIEEQPEEQEGEEIDADKD